MLKEYIYRHNPIVNIFKRIPLDNTDLSSKRIYNFLTKRLLNTENNGKIIKNPQHKIISQTPIVNKDTTITVTITTQTELISILNNTTGVTGTYLFTKISENPNTYSRTFTFEENTSLTFNESNTTYPIRTIFVEGEEISGKTVEIENDTNITIYSNANVRVNYYKSDDTSIGIGTVTILSEIGLLPDIDINLYLSAGYVYSYVTPTTIVEYGTYIYRVYYDPIT